jgi:hypothetical protein
MRSNKRIEHFRPAQSLHSQAENALDRAADLMLWTAQRTWSSRFSADPCLARDMAAQRCPRTGLRFSVRRPSPRCRPFGRRFAGRRIGPLAATACGAPHASGVHRLSSGSCSCRCLNLSLTRAQQIHQGRDIGELLEIMDQRKALLDSIRFQTRSRNQRAVFCIDVAPFDPEGAGALWQIDSAG